MATGSHEWDPRNPSHYIPAPHSPHLVSPPEQQLPDQAFRAVAALDNEEWRQAMLGEIELRHTNRTLETTDSLFESFGLRGTTPNNNRTTDDAHARQQEPAASSVHHKYLPTPTSIQPSQFQFDHALLDHHHHHPHPHHAPGSGQQSPSWEFAGPAHLPASNSNEFHSVASGLAQAASPLALEGYRPLDFAGSHTFPHSYNSPTFSGDHSATASLSPPLQPPPPSSASQSKPAPRQGSSSSSSLEQDRGQGWSPASTVEQQQHHRAMPPIDSWRSADDASQVYAQYPGVPMNGYGVPAPYLPGYTNHVAAGHGYAPVAQDIYGRPVYPGPPPGLWPHQLPPVNSHSPYFPTMNTYPLPSPSSETAPSFPSTNQHTPHDTPAAERPRQLSSATASSHVSPNVDLAPEPVPTLAATEETASTEDKAVGTSKTAAVVSKEPKRPRKSKASAEPKDQDTAAKPVMRKGSKKVTVDMLAHCTSCGELVARLICRGQPHEFDVPHAAVYRCARCGGVPSSSSESPDAQAPDDKLAHTTTAGKPKVSKASASFRKRHKRDDGGADTTSCDVCLRDVATGGVYANDNQAHVDFYIEVICAHCDETYRRCSDCGGGGGMRLGVGKWRSKELFSAGRKTCTLSHLRLGALSDMHYDIWPITQIPRDEVDEIADICGAIFTNTLLANMCIPEVFEQQSAIKNTYEGVRTMATRGWNAIEPMLRVDVENTRHTRRYLALRSCTPNPRKGSKVVEISSSEHQHRTILRPKTEVVGFISAEWDFLIGSLFLGVVVPWALLQRVEDDRLSLNHERARRQLAPLPALVQTWTMMFFKRESRMINHLEKKRGFVPLEDYVKQYPHVHANAFPPIRPVYMPPDRLEGWQVMVRRHTGDDDFSVRRTSSDVQGKNKEQKAKARREAEEKDRDDQAWRG